MRIPKTALAAAKCCSEGGRWAHDAIKLESKDGDCHAIGSDGRQMVVFAWHDPHRDDFDGLLLDKDAETLAKAAGKGQLAVSVYEANGQVFARAINKTTATEITPQKVEGRFPPWREVLWRPTPENSVTVTLDHRFLANLARIVADHALECDDRGVTITVCTNKVAPVLIAARGPNGKAVGAVMPFGDPDAPPSCAWFDPPKDQPCPPPAEDDSEPEEPTDIDSPEAVDTVIEPAEPAWKVRLRAKFATTS